MYFDVKCNIDDFDKYFSVIGAVNYLCAKTNKPVYEIAKYLINNKYVFKLKSYKKNSLAGHCYDIFEMISDNVKVDKLSAIEYLLENINDYPTNKKIEYFSYPEGITYWEKDEFLNLVETIELVSQPQETVKKNNNEIRDMESRSSLQKILKLNDHYISVLDAFEAIRNKTDLKSDSEIANFLVVNKINDLTIPFDKFNYFDGKPTRLHKDFQQNKITKMDLLLLEIAREELQVSNSDKRLKSFVWDKFDFFLEFKNLTNVDLDEEVSLSNIEEDNSMQTPDREENNVEQLKSDLPLHIKILAMNDFFTIVESACFISLDEPEKIQAYLNSGNLTYDAWRYGEHMQAVKVIEGGIKAKKLDIDNDGMIPRASLQQFLLGRNYVVSGFNDNLSVQDFIGCGQPSIQQTEPNIENLNSEIIRLRELINKKDEEINQLQQHQKVSEYTYNLNNLIKKSEKDSKIREQEEKIEQLSVVNEQFSNEIYFLKKRIAAIASINPTLAIDNQDQTIQVTNGNQLDLTPEQEIPNSRQRNNVLRIISILSEMAGLPPEPFTAFNMMEAHATQNSKELPKKDTTADWLKKARNSN